MVKRYNGQSYSTLKKRSQKEGYLFEDVSFPTDASSLYLDSSSQSGSIEWKRPGEICDNPRLVVDGVEGNDLNQGEVGNCWFVAACASLAGERKLWNHVVPDVKQQEWDEAAPEKYAGIFKFRFWRFGEMIEVVIDDRLPTKNGRLIYCHSKQRNEFWSPLLEKAYAKLAGCYEALNAGSTVDALVDFSGGVSETIKLDSGNYSTDEGKRKELFRNMEKAMTRQAMLSCAITANPEVLEEKMDVGLVKGHAYGITAVKKVVVEEGFFRDKKLFMIRLRNPWGGKEWNGPWSDGSSEWKQVPEKEKKRIGLNFDDDGEFWMDFEDWSKYFTQCSICRIINTSILSIHKTWHEAKHVGQWIGEKAGGCINNKDTFLKNPQYAFDVRHDDEGITMISLQQQDRRSLKRKGNEGKNLTIGFLIMKVEENRIYRLHTIYETAGTVTFVDSRSVFGRFDLQEGRYIIVPSTFEPRVEGEYLLRIFTENDSRSKFLRHDVPPPIPCYRMCCSTYPTAIVTVEIQGCENLKSSNVFGGGADPYVIVSCEGVKARTPVKKSTLDPIFNSQFVFYVKRPRTAKIILQIWNYNALVDDFLGQVNLPIEVKKEKSMQFSKQLMGRRSQKDEATQGSITATVFFSQDLSSV
ncbi:calpain-5-like isoform X2 [Oscarella lobularis]|uniref:calpain-5-like isoform X2 n=1 Tax=Oscarella lobularis TaxID=121494 RepID=UPI0033137110